MKYCPRCKQFLSRDTFGKWSIAPDGLRTYCKPCNAAKARDYTARQPKRERPPALPSNEIKRRWAQRNPDKVKAHRKAWAATEKGRLYRNTKKSRRRARLLGNGGYHSVYDRYGIYFNQEGKCFYCGQVLTISEGHFDHIIAVALGGTDNPDNLCFTCPPCNHRKGAKDVIAWMEEQNKLEREGERPAWDAGL